MGNWSTLHALVNAAVENTFGEPASYQRVLAGAASGDPATITVTRCTRPHEESGAAANLEEIAINPADLANYPQRGDWVTAWGLQFVVSSVRQPDPYGLVFVTMTKRAGE